MKRRWGRGEEGGGRGGKGVREGMVKLHSIWLGSHCNNGLYRSRIVVYIC